MIKPSTEVAEFYFERIFDISDDGIFFVDQDGKILRVNPAFTKILGYEEAEIVGKSVIVLTHKKRDLLDDKVSTRLPLHRLLISEKEEVEEVFYDREETAIPLRLHSILLSDEGGKVNGAIGVFKRITETSDSKAPGRILQDKMWEAQQNFENLLNYSVDSIIICDIAGYVVITNKSFLSTLDYELRDIVGKHVAELTPCEEKTYQTTTGEEIVVDMADLERRAAAAGELLEKGVKQNWDTHFLRRDGVAVPAEINISVLKDAEGKRRGSILISRDVTQRRIIESELTSYRLHLEDLVKKRTFELKIVNEQLQADIIERRQAQESLQMVLETANDGIITADKAGYIRSWNKGAEVLYGYTAEEIIGQSSLMLIVPESRHIQRNAIDSGIQWIDPSNAPSRIEGTSLRKDNTSFSAELSISSSLINDELLYTVIVRDISDRKIKEEELQRLRNYLKNIIDSMPSALVGVDKDGLITQWNVGAEKMTGVVVNNAVGRPLDRVLPLFSGKMEKIKRAMQERTSSKDERIVQRIDGENHFEDISVYPLIANGIDGAVVRIDDVTERVRLEDMMIQSEKMLSVGGLAAGMAHEINNPLAGILQSAQVMQNRISANLAANRTTAESCGTSMQAIESYMEKRGIFNMVEAIVDSGRRASKIVENMLSFSRKSSDVFERRDLVELLDSAIDLAEKDYDLERKYDFKKIRIVRDYDLNLPKITCEGNRIQQVILNLLRNGAYSMFQLEDDREPRFIVRLMKDDDMACIEVTDNGTGMNEDVRKRIFEPFFTTKAEGIGTGLGLSVSYFIVTENHGGTMEVASRIDKGTTFTIRLPLDS
ncbi:MAG: PAS domain S-box protein [Proteobacteria bacterium]|nr:PAS domain S-box protein [Pseudomonadota bacterium]